MTYPTPGPRQTIDRACHPTLGEGVAVYDNGPAYFRADSGEVVPMRKVDFGGVCVTEGSWLNAVTEAGKSVKLDTTKREHGTRWDRVVGQMHGHGWLGRGGKKHPTSRAQFCRFEPDAGPAFDFWMSAIWVGLPKHDTLTRRLGAKKEKAVWEERKDCRWVTIKTIDGSMFVYMREEDAKSEPDKAAAPTPAAAPEQMGLF
jgi:hypothetical protein